MGAKPKTVGGGAAKNTAIGFNDFLMQGLTTGSFGNVADPRIAQGQALQNNPFQNKGGMWGSIGNQMSQAGQKLQGQAYGGAGGGQPNSVQQSQGQTGLFGGAINSLLGANPNDMINSNQYLSQLGNINQNAPQFQGAQMSALGTNYNPQSLMGQFGDVFGGQQNTDLGSIFGQMQGMGFGGGGQGLTGDFSYRPGQLMNYNTQSPEFQALNQLNQQQTQMDAANLRSRYGKFGGALSSGASRAEAQMRAEANPRNILAMGQLGRQMQEMDLGQQSINNQLRTNLLGTQTQGEVGMAGVGAQREGSMMNALGNIYGQNLNYNMNRGNSLINAGQMDNQNMAQAFGINSANQQTNNQNAFNNSQAQNQFNQNAFGQMSQNQMGMANIGAQLQQLMQSGQLGAMGNIFGALGQSNQLGTPQAQTVMQPSAFSQGLGALTGIAGIAGGFMGGNPLGALGGISQFGGNFGQGNPLSGSTPFMNSNQGLFGGQNLGMGGSMQQNSGINPNSLMAGGGMQTGGPMFQNAFPNMMNGQAMPQFNGGLRFPNLGMGR